MRPFLLILTFTLSLGAGRLAAAPAAPASPAGEGARQLTGPERIAAAESAYTYINRSYKRILELLEKAKSEHDIVLIQCLNENLQSMKGLLKVAQQSLTSLQESVAKDNRDDADFEYGKIGIAQSRARSTLQLAMQCRGRKDAYTGITKVDVIAPAAEPPSPAPSTPTLPPSPPISSYYIP